MLEHFVKDVVFPLTPHPNNAEQKGTIGAYFIHVDNPNGEFQHMYTPPKNTRLSTNVLNNDLRRMKMPYEGTVVQTNKGVGGTYAFQPLGTAYMREVLENYIILLKVAGIDAPFSEDFITHYTRPFNAEWQKIMGLEELFDEKFGLIDRSIKYVN